MFIIKFFLFTRFGLILTILGVLVGGFYFWLHEHDKNITDNALNTFNTAQQEVYKQKQDEYVQKTEAISNDAVIIANNANNLNNEEKTKLDLVENTSNASDENKISSLYLKNIIKQLNILYGGK
jgi:hypothetical protein